MVYPPIQVLTGPSVD